MGSCILATARFESMDQQGVDLRCAACGKLARAVSHLLCGCSCVAERFRTAASGALLSRAVVGLTAVLARYYPTTAALIASFTKQRVSNISCIQCFKHTYVNKSLHVHMLFALRVFRMVGYDIT